MWKRTYTWTCGCNDRPWRCRNRRRYHNHALRECSVHRRILDAICENRNQCSERSHYNDIIMSAVASQITGVSIVYPIVCSGADQRKHQTPLHWPLWGELLVTGEFPAQKASNAENVSIWWCHHKLVECERTNKMWRSSNEFSWYKFNSMSFPQCEQQLTFNHSQLDVKGC